ncbi:MAG: ABC transporter permease [Bacillaceae bacterium]|jgi:teichoic acid transport system permease protein|uniref:Transport permease protein n=1 Tax=Aeribacillus composti TaxID=1868734 RepID=A0ABY9WBT9_9BACI|nr:MULTISPECIES: ABC transporter permease [Aeribacillus]REJ18349.1 MAG: ABC transporter permease [Bacillaceae bacterium]KZM57615.1 teichoic acid ABC transporter permease [Aeribacillus pallidus]MED0651827.1 ABC transporter permease [Aeribacillus composti]MED4486361.1 ABC transporter permease [Aeribacillus pallidus]RZI51164.1 ABC transporter permease [Aeribacillus pallidus]
MKSAITVIKEQINHFYLIRRLSLYELKSKNKNNYLGMAWEVINPLIQILIYWFVFGSIQKRADIQVIPGMDVPFIAWLMGGFILWTFFYQSTIQGSKSIYTRLAMLSKMNFPMSAIPSFVIFSQFYVHLFMLIIVLILLQFMGYFINVYYLQLIYFMFATICLLFAVSLIMSTLSTIIRDVHMFLNATLRMFLYLSPVLWPISAVLDNATIITILKLNPLYYLIEGYRSAFFGTEWYFITNWQYTLYFWGLVIVLFLFGSMLHMKFRRHFIDYL